MTIGPAHNVLAADARVTRPSGRLIPSDNLFRAAAAIARSDKRNGPSATEIIRREYPDDARTLALTKAAVSPANLDSSTWASVLATGSVTSFIAGLGPTSAAAQLLKSGLLIDLAGYGSAKIPSLIATDDLASYVAAGDPIRVVNLTLSGPLLVPFKIKTIAVYTSETTLLPDFESILRQTLSEAVGLALDNVVLSAAAATTSAPAGLLNGATAITPASAGSEALITDLSALANAVAGISGPSVAFVASPAQFMSIKLRAGPGFAFPVYSSAALPEGTVAAFATNAITAAVSPVPEISRATEGVFHMSDSAPLPIGAMSPPPPVAVVAAPARELFQTDCVGLRVTLNASFGLRAPAADSVATLAAANW